MGGEDRDDIDLEVRPAADADEAALIELWNACGLLRWYNEPHRDIALWRESDCAEILVGKVEERAVASACIGHDGHRGWMYYVAVHPGHRGRGYGRQIVRAAEMWLSERRLRKSQAMVRASNLQACDFYQALGYEQDPVAVMARWLDERGLPPGGEPRPDSEGRIETIVTYLEMTEPPAAPPPPAPAGTRVALIRAEPPTVAFYRFLYDAVGSQWLWWERRALDDAALARIVQDSRVEVYVLYVDGTPAGFAELDRRREPDIELAYFGLMPEFIGRGLGAYLLGAAVEIAWSHAPGRLTVNTNTLDHPRALPLYQRAGFRPYERETRVIHDPRLSGLIPRE